MQPILASLCSLELQTIGWKHQYTMELQQGRNQLWTVPIRCRCRRRGAGADWLECLPAQQQIDTQLGLHDRGGAAAVAGDGKGEVLMVMVVVERRCRNSEDWRWGSLLDPHPLLSPPWLLIAKLVCVCINHFFLLIVVGLCFIILGIYFVLSYDVCLYMKFSMFCQTCVSRLSLMWDSLNIFCWTIIFFAFFDCAIRI